MVREYRYHTCPEPPAETESGSGSGSASQSQAQNEDPPYGGGGSGGGGSTTVNDPVKDPCAEAAALKASYDIALNRANMVAIGNYAANGNEWGATARISSISNNSPSANPAVQTNPTEGTPDSWTFQFKWNATDGYDVSSNHFHLNEKAPGLEDVMRLVENAKHGQTLASGASGIAYYKEHASAATTTVSGNYAVTVKKWEGNSGATALYDKYASTDPAVNNSVAIGNQYNTAYQEYLIDNAGDKGGASIHALETVFPNMLNIYRAEPGTRDFKPTKTIKSIEFGIPKLRNSIKDNC